MIIAPLIPVNSYPGDFNVGGDFSIAGSLTVTGTTELSGSTTIRGDLKIHGDTYNYGETYIVDPITIVNYLSGAVGISGVETRYAGLEVDRGDLTNYRIVFDENDDYFKIGQIGNEQVAATRTDDIADEEITMYDSTTKQLSGSGITRTQIEQAFTDITGLQTISGDHETRIVALEDGTTLDSRYVNTTGDTMTGNLSINGATLTVGTVASTYLYDAENEFGTPEANLTWSTDHFENSIINGSDITDSYTAGNIVSSDAMAFDPGTGTDIMNWNDGQVSDAAGSYTYWTVVPTTYKSLVLDNGSAIAVNNVRFYMRGVSGSIRTCTHFRLYGSNTSGTGPWTEVIAETATGVTTTSNEWSSYFETTDKTAYRYWKIDQKGGTGAYLYFYEIEMLEAQYASTTNTVTTTIINGAGTIDANSLVIKNQGGTALSDAQVNVAYSTDGGAFSSLVSLDTFKALGLLSYSTSFQLKVQPVNANHIALVTFDTIQSATIITQNGIEAVVNSVRKSFLSNDGQLELDDSTQPSAPTDGIILYSVNEVLTYIDSISGVHTLADTTLVANISSNLQSQINDLADGTTLDSRYVNVTGDTMTGNLVVNANITSSGTISGANIYSPDNINKTGTPLNNQVATFTDANTVDGSTALTFDGSDLDVTAGSTYVKIGKTGIINILNSSNILTRTSAVVGDAFNRYERDTDGTMRFGDGSGATDTNLYRGSANLLVTDDAFRALSIQISGSGQYIDQLGGVLRLTDGVNGTVTLTELANAVDNYIDTNGDTLLGTLSVDSNSATIAATESISQLTSSDRFLVKDASDSNYLKEILVSDMFAPYTQTNLLTNGEFSVNQRAFSTSTPEAIDPSVYPHTIDVWQVMGGGATTVTSISGNQLSTGSGLRFTGTATAGQVISLRNRCPEIFDTLYNASEGDIATTARVKALNNSGSPITLDVVPMYGTGVASEEYTTNPTISGGDWGQAISVYTTEFQGNSSTHFTINITITQSGSYDFTLYSAAQIMGYHTSPPRICPVQHGEEIRRCQRYYQTGSIRTRSRFVDYNGTQALIRETRDFGIRMYAAPTVTLTLGEFKSFDGAAGTVDVSGGSYGLSSEAVDTNGFVYNLDLDGDATNGQRLVNYGGQYYITWEAAIN